MSKYIGYIFDILLITGILIAIKPSVEKLFISKKMISQVEKKYSRINKKKNDKLTEYIINLIYATLGIKSYYSYMVFIIVSSLLGFIGVFMTIKVLPILFGIIVSIIMLFIPYIFLILKKRNVSVKISREGDLLISELLNNYKICYFNIEEAITKTASDIEDAPYSKKILYDLSKGLNIAATNEDILELTNNFGKAISTSWGNILAVNIYFACTRGIKITNSLQDLSESILKSRKVIEHCKRENNEAHLILKYLVPICYILTIIGAKKYFGFSISKFIKYQFMTKTGLIWFLIICISYLISIVVFSFLNNRKMEI